MTSLGEKLPDIVFVGDDLESDREFDEDKEIDCTKLQLHLVNLCASCSIIF